MLVYQLAGRLAELLLVGQSALLSHLAVWLPDQPGHFGGTARPFLGACTIGPAFVSGVLREFRLGVRYFTLRFRRDIRALLLRAFVVRCVLLEFLEQSTNRLVVHPLQAGQRQRRAVTDREKHDGVALRRRLQLVVEQTFIHDADVLGREVGKVHGNGHPHAPAPLPDPRLRTGQEVQHAVDTPVGNDFAAEARRLEHVEGTGDSVPGVATARCKELAAVCSDRKVGVVRPIVHQLEEGKNARPRPEDLAHGLSARIAAFQLVEETVQAVALVIDGVVPRKQVA